MHTTCFRGAGAKSQDAPSRTTAPGACRAGVFRALAVAVVTLALVLCGCGKPLDTEQNRALVTASAISEVLPGSHDAMNELIKGVLGTATYTPIEGPWILMRETLEAAGYNDDGTPLESAGSGGEGAGYVLRIAGCSESELTAETLAEMRTLVLCVSEVTRSTYRSSGGVTAMGSTEHCTLYYFDLQTGTYLGSERVGGQSLPESASRAPRYTIDNGTLAKAVKERVASGIDLRYRTDAFVIDADGTLSSVNVDNIRVPDDSVMYLPEGITAIKSGVMSVPKFDMLGMLHVPQSVVSIEPGAFSPRTALAVVAGSAAQEYAIENGMTYCLEDDCGELFVPEGVTTWEVSGHALRIATAVHVPASVTEFGMRVVSSFGTLGYGEHIVIYAPEGSFAAEYALEHGLAVEIIASA